MQDEKTALLSLLPDDPACFANPIYCADSVDVGSVSDVVELEDVSPCPFVPLCFRAEWPCLQTVQALNKEVSELKELVGTVQALNTEVSELKELVGLQNKQ
jgi:hypothetical protein